MVLRFAFKIYGEIKLRSHSQNPTVSLQSRRNKPFLPFSRSPRITGGHREVNEFSLTTTSLFPVLDPPSLFFQCFSMPKLSTLKCESCTRHYSRRLCLVNARGRFLFLKHSMHQGMI
uniref:(northern house mosquito) hypothetical protein n=1 Tax=Culex pipiens TaxID=7175 RepID=A0A8D8CB71_CULPI